MIASTRASILSVGLALSINAEEPNRQNEVEIRVHVPYTERLENEQFHRMIVRIENHGETPLILLTDRDEGIAEFAQFRSQTREDVANGTPPSYSPWDGVKQHADLSIPSGQAIEMIGGSAMGVNLPPNGESRLVFQIGPDELVYSNWVDLKTIPAQDISDWPVIATEQLTPGETGLNEFLIGTTPTGKWLFRRPVWNKSIFSRVCPLPGGETPNIVGDPNKWQAAAVFESHPDATTYFSGALGISRSTPWPDHHRGADFINKPIPVDTPSPLEFPMELFGDTTRPSEMEVGHEAPNGSQAPVGVRKNLGSQMNGVSQDPPPEGSSGHPLWIWIIGGCVLIGALALALFRFGRNRG